MSEKNESLLESGIVETLIKEEGKVRCLFYGFLLGTIFDIN